MDKYGWTAYHCGATFRADVASVIAPPLTNTIIFNLVSKGVSINLSKCRGTILYLLKYNTDYFF